MSSDVSVRKRNYVRWISTQLKWAHPSRSLQSISRAIANTSRVVRSSLGSVKVATTPIKAHPSPHTVKLCDCSVRFVRARGAGVENRYQASRNGRKNGTSDRLKLHLSSAPLAKWGVSPLNFRQGLLEIRDQVVRILDAHRNADQRIGDTHAIAG